MILKQKLGQKYVYRAVLLSSILVAVVVGLHFMKPVSAADPVITGGSPIVGQTDIYIPVEGVEIQGDVVGTTTVSVRVSSGTLRMTTVTGLTFQSAQTGSTITFDGTKEDLNAALATLQYRANNPGAVNLTVTLGAPGIVYYPGNGHIYEVVPVEGGISWDEAKIAAEARTMNGAQGYLATISEQAENDYITARLVGDGWFGATDIDDEGQWDWVTGPETGTLFWQGQGNGAVESGQFANWAYGEPNEYGSGEDCAQFYGDGSGWNDLPCSDFTLGSYVVEYGAPGNMPVVPSEVVVPTTTTAPEPESVALSTCEQFFAEFVESNEHRYDNITLTQDLDCGGVSINALFSEVEQVYDDDEGEYVSAPIAFRGTFNGNGHTIQGLNITPRVDEDEDYLPNGLFGATDDGVVIENLRLESVTVSGAECVGGIVGAARSITMDNVHFDGTIGLADGWGEDLGGLVGCLDSSEGNSTVENSTVDGSLVQTSDDGYRVGGLIGELQIEPNDSEADVAVVIENNQVTGSVTGYGAVGGLIGYVYMYSEPSSVVVTNNSTSGVTSSSDGYNVGGAFGELYIEDGSFEASDISVTGDVIGGSSVGGIIGSISSYDTVSLHDISFTHDVVGGDSSVGGIIGDVYHYGETAESLSLTAVSSSGSTTGSYCVGGLVGSLEAYNSEDYEAQSATLFQSSATGTVTATQGYYAGGLAGNMYGTVVDQSYATGSVQALNDQTAGGLVGLSQSSLIRDSYARGSVSTGWGYGGGLIGTAQYATTIENSYATGQVSALEAEATNSGGLVGFNDDEESTSAQRSYWDTQTSGQSSSAFGTGKTTTAMKSMSTFVDWNFEDVWGLSTEKNNGYPCLRWTEGCTNSGDQDGISDSVEAAAPNGGDANQDGTADNQQAHVSSFVNQQSGQYVALEVDPSCTITAVTALNENDVARQDSGYYYSLGLLDFALVCGTNGFTTTVKQYYYGTESVDGMVVRKYNPNTQLYQTVTGNGLELTTEVIDGRSVAVLSYEVTDGGELDTDGQVNGEIIDPVGLAFVGVGAPNTGIAPTQMPPFALLTVTSALCSVMAVVLPRLFLTKSK